MAPIQLIIIFSLTLITTKLLKLCFSVINARQNKKTAVGFFHPYTNDGGGGERVLWCAVKAIQEENPDLQCLVYTGDHDATPQSLFNRALDRFGVTLLSHPKVVIFSEIYHMGFCKDSSFCFYNNFDSCNAYWVVTILCDDEMRYY